MRNGSISPRTGEMKTSCSPLPTPAAVVSPRRADPFSQERGEAPWPRGSVWFYYFFFSRTSQPLFEAVQSCLGPAWRRGVRRPLRADWPHASGGGDDLIPQRKKIMLKTGYVIFCAGRPPLFFYPEYASYTLQRCDISRPFQGGKKIEQLRAASSPTTQYCRAQRCSRAPGFSLFLLHASRTPR